MSVEQDKFEYREINVIEDLINRLNEEGNDGWEAVYIKPHTFIEYTHPQNRSIPSSIPYSRIGNIVILKRKYFN